jgi:DNA-binding GntR family transcriptional regulator
LSEVYIGPNTQPLPAGSLKDHPSLHERAYHLVRSAILEGAYKPGERIFEAAIAEALGVSRNPVREAIRRLQQEGLVEVRRRSGVFVASLSIDEVRDLYRIRAALEGVAAALAAQRMSDVELVRLRSILDRMQPHGGRSDDAVREVVAEFHACIRVAAHSPPLAALLDQVFAQVSRSKGLAFAVEPSTAHTEHEPLFNSICRRDSDSAERLMHQHVLEAYARVMRGHPEGGPRQGNS